MGFYVVLLSQSLKQTNAIDRATCAGYSNDETHRIVSCPTNNFIKRCPFLPLAALLLLAWSLPLFVVAPCQRQQRPTLFKNLFAGQDTA